MTKKRKTAKNSKSARKPKPAAAKSARKAFSIATNARKTVTERIAAMAESPLVVCQSDDDLQAMLNVLRDKDEPVQVRMAALQSLQTASFSVVEFESCRSDYIATLRKIASDADPELRQRALGILAREKDGFAQKKLLEGLQDSEKALVSPEKALQLLSYDVHSEAYPVARAIAGKAPNVAARREALRLLAADATSAPLFEKLLRDKDELREIRQISASALQSLKPEKLQAHAREILLDASEYDDIQATSLTALTQFGNQESVGSDEPLLKRVESLRGEAAAKLKKSARQFLNKYGR